MANFAFIDPPSKLPWYRRFDWGEATLWLVAAVLMVGIVGAIFQALGLNPGGALSLPALAVQYKFVDQKAGLSSSGYLGLNATKGNWVGATVYAVGDTVINGGFLYRCSVAGAAAAAPGPSPNTLVDNAATWVLVGPVSGLCISDATAQHELGYQAIAKDDTYGIATFIYAKFTGTTVAGDFVIFDAFNKTAVQTPAAAPGAAKMSKIGISMGSQANGTFGWIMIQGIHDQANVAAGGTVGNNMSGVAVVGRATTVATANYAFSGVVLRNAGVVGTGTVELWWPCCTGTTST